MLLGADPALRDSMTGLSNPKLIRRCADLDPSQPDTPAAAVEYTLRRLARRIIELTREIDDMNQRIVPLRVIRVHRRTVRQTIDSAEPPFQFLVDTTRRPAGAAG